MNKALMILLSAFSILARLCEAWEDNSSVPGKLEGDDLCRLGNFLTIADKVAVSEIRVEDIQHVPLRSSAGTHLSVKPRASVVLMKRNLLGSGAHRELETDITLEFEVDQRSQDMKECDVVFLEKLANGIFVDPFQLQRLKQQNAFKEVRVYGDVDLERPARTSYQSIVEVHSALVETEEAMIGVVSKLLHAKVSLPVHARYPPTSADSYFQLNITMPQLMVKCKKREGSTIDYGKEICIHAFTDLPSQTLHWFIPAGNLLHSLLVDGVTTCAAVIGVVSVFLASKKSSVMNNFESTRGAS